MQSPDRNPPSITDTIEEERLRKWREQRAKVAETSRQERIKIAEAERRKRLEEFEADKARRIKEAAEQRARQQAAKAAERMAIARSKIPGRTDIDAARNRLLAYRRREARALALRLSLFVLCPTLLVAVYVIWLATPLYTSELRVALTAPTASQGGASSSPFTTTPVSHEAHQLREVILSPLMLEALDTRDGFTKHFSAPQIDPLTRMSPSALLQHDRHEVFKRYVDVTVNGQDGMLHVKTKAADPKTAQAFANTILTHATTWLETARGVSPSAETPKPDALRVISPPNLAEIAAYPKRLNTIAMAFLSFLGLYAAGAIFIRTLRRHGQH